jgi:methylmalonyl-CoA mutase N-terminal domain/subunit
MESEAEAIFARIKDMSPDGTMTGGILQGIETGWFTGEIAEASFAYQQQLEKGEKKIVGVNTHTESVAEPLEILRISPEVEREQVATLRGRRAQRDQHAVDVALSTLVAVARTDGNLVPPMLEAARAEATLGEICDALRAEWGSYTEPASF